MAPIKSSGPKGKSRPSGKSGSSSKSSKPKGGTPSGISKRKAKSLSLAKPGGAQKTKSLASTDTKNKKKRVYTEKELNIPQLNGIVPAGIAKPKGQKKGKVFVDDPESMMAIMSVVNAEKEGHIESKIQKARQWEEVREAKRKELEKRSEEKKKKFEERKEGLKGKKGKRRHSDDARVAVEEEDEKPKDKKARKRVSFG